MPGRAAAVFIGLAAFSGVAFALARSASNGPVDGVNWTSLHYDIVDLGESIVGSIDTSAYQAIEPEASAQYTREVNRRAFLATIRSAEGTDRAADPYRVVMGYGHTLADLSDHPYFTGEWAGAPFGDGQFSTAAGAYQFIRKTWSALRDKLQLPDFGPASQDLAALELIRERGALGDVDAGRFVAALHKCRRVWASLPGAGYGQGERSLQWLAARYQQAGGQLA